MTAAFLLLAFLPTEQPVASPSVSITYTQYYNCIISPMPTGPVGQWTQLCNGQWAGWGWQPGHSCTYTVEEVFEYCY